jgi:hypothetical protein
VLSLPYSPVSSKEPESAKDPDVTNEPEIFISYASAPVKALTDCDT